MITVKNTVNTSPPVYSYSDGRREKERREKGKINQFGRLMEEDNGWMEEADIHTFLITS